MMRTIIAAITGALVLLALAFWWGYSQGQRSVKLSDFEQYEVTVKARDALQDKLNASDVELQKKQQELKEARANKVVEKVTVYRDRIKESATAQCVKESGILDLYDATIK